MTDHQRPDDPTTGDQADGEPVDWSRFDTDAHKAAQNNCWCVIACAVDGAHRQQVSEAIRYARAVGDVAALPLLIAQMTGPCTLPAAPPTQDGPTSTT